MKRMDVIKTLKYIKIARMVGKPANETNAWLHGIFDLLYGIAEVLDVFDEEDDEEDDGEEGEAGGGSKSLGDGRQNPIAPKGTREK